MDTEVSEDSERGLRKTRTARKEAGSEKTEKRSDGGRFLKPVMGANFY